MRIVVLLLLLCLTPPPVLAAGGVVPATLSASEQVDITRIQAYLDDLKTLSADFMQVQDNGGILRGTIAIQRPGKMRVTYDPPNKDFVVADGTSVHIWNDDLQEQTNVEEDSSIANFILRDPIRLNGDVVVTKFERFPAKIEVTLVQANDAGAGQLTLIFEDRPLKLRQWRVIDAQGHSTGVNLENIREGVSFPQSLFNFVPPSFGKNARIKSP